MVRKLEPGENPLEDLEQDPVPKSVRGERVEKPKPAPVKISGSRSRSSKPSLESPINAMLQMVGRVWSVRDDVCGGALLAQAPMIAQQLNALAQTDPKVYRMLSRMMSGGGWGGVILATWPVAASIAEHHIRPGLAKARARRTGELIEEPTG